MSSYPTTTKRSIGHIVIFVIAGIILNWAVILMLPAFKENGLLSALELAPKMLLRPFDITFYPESRLLLVVANILYVLAILYYLNSPKKYRYGKEYGSAEWGDPIKIVKKYRDKKADQNLLLTKNMMLSLNTFKHRRNLNVLVIGGSGSGKSRAYVVPNILQKNANYVVLDPSGELEKMTRRTLEADGYKVLKLDLENMFESDRSNPFVNIEKEEDILSLIKCYVTSTEDKGTTKGDQFWIHAEQMFLTACMLAVWKYAIPEEQNFTTIIEMHKAASESEDSDEISALDLLFKEIRRKYPDCLSVASYDRFKQGAEKTLQNILITIGARIQTLDLPGVRYLLSEDDLNIREWSEKKIALFICTPENDKSFNYIASMIYTQLFTLLYRMAKTSDAGRFERPIMFFMDEFANVVLPDGFPEIIATARKYNIGISVIIQSLAQIKSLYEKTWEAIVGNCDTLLYLGGNEQASHKYVNQMLGRETIDTKTFSSSKGRSGSYTTNLNLQGRELMGINEIRELDNDLAILLVRGEKPMIDRKLKIVTKI